MAALVAAEGEAPAEEKTEFFVMFAAAVGVVLQVVVAETIAKLEAVVAASLMRGRCTAQWLH